MTDDLEKHFEEGRNRAAQGKSSSIGLISTEFSSKAEKAAAQRGWEAQKTADSYKNQTGATEHSSSSYSGDESVGLGMLFLGFPIRGFIAFYVLKLIFAIFIAVAVKAANGEPVAATVWAISGNTAGTVAVCGVLFAYYHALTDKKTWENISIQLIAIVIIAVAIGAFLGIGKILNGFMPITPSHQAITEVAPTIEQIEEYSAEQSIEQSPTETAIEDQPPQQGEPSQCCWPAVTETAIEDQPPQQEPTEELYSHSAELTLARKPEETPQRLTTYYFQVGNPKASSTIEIAAPTPEKAEQILRNFRGNPTVIQGPTTVVTW